MTVVDEWLQVALPLATGAAGYFGRGEYARFTERGRLPGNLTAQLDMLAKMPASPVRDELQRHVETQVRYLVAHEQLSPVEQRLAWQWNLATLGGGLSIALLPLADETIGGGPVAPAIFVGGMLCAMLGLKRLMDGRLRRNEDKLVRLAQAEARSRHDTEARSRHDTGGADGGPGSSEG